MGTKGRKERGQTARQPPEETHGRSRRSGGQAEGRQEGREERGTRMATRLGSGGGNREKHKQQGGDQEEIRQTEKKRYINI